MRPLRLFLVLCWILLTPLQGETPSSGNLTLFFSGFVSGNYGPCGCENNPTGGLSRRAGYAAAYQVRTGIPVIHVDAGNYFSARGAYANRINEFMLEGLAKLPVRVLNLAPEDLYMWPELADPLPGTSIISTNLVPLDSGVPQPKTFSTLIIQADLMGFSKDLRIGFLGISDPERLKPNSRFQARDPLEAVAETIPSLSGQVDLIVLLADIERETAPLAKDSLLHRIAVAHPEISVILSTEKYYRLHKPEQIGKTVVLTSVERGRYLGQLQLRLDSEGRILSWEPEYIEMKKGVEEDPELLRKQLLLESRLFSH